jgi:polar amino acid transport system substrate-binding protein
MTVPTDALIEPGVLLIGVDKAPPAPLNFGLPGSPDFYGFEVDLTAAIGARLDLAVRYRSALWSTILNELAERRLDLVCGAATVTEARRQIVAFSEPYLDVRLVLVARDEQEPLQLDELTDRDVGVRAGTEAEHYVRAQVPSARVHTFNLNTAQYDALAHGQVDAVIDDAPIAGYFARSRAGLRVGTALPGTEAQYAFVFACDNTGLRDAVNEALRLVKADGTWARLRREWLADPAPRSERGSQRA